MSLLFLFLSLTMYLLNCLGIILLTTRHPVVLDTHTHYMSAIVILDYVLSEILQLTLVY